MMNLFLFYQFAKFGILCFGGGYMLIPLLFETYVQQNHFFTLEEFGNLLSISQLTPGAVSVNTATYVGFLKNGPIGSICATLGLVFPTLILASLALSAMQKFKNSIVLNGLLKGGRLGAVVMLGYAVILFAGISIVKINPTLSEWHINGLELCICIGAMILTYKTKISITLILFISLLIGGLSKQVFAQQSSFTDETPYTASACEQGNPMAWNNACVCHAGWTGAHCTHESTQSCSQTNPCKDTKQYCQDGYCHFPYHYASIPAKNLNLVVSRSIMTWDEAQDFCKVLKMQPASRKDFGCNGLGIGCLDTHSFQTLQEKLEYRGFIWLDEEKNQQAYYADLNDLNVYLSQKTSRAVCQALCVSFSDGEIK